MEIKLHVSEILWRLIQENKKLFPELKLILEQQLDLCAYDHETATITFKKSK